MHLQKVPHNIIHPYSYLYTGEDFEEEELSIWDLHGLLILLQCVAAKWRSIGLALGFLDRELHVIEIKPENVDGGPLHCFRDLLSRWLKWEPPNHTWPTVKDLARALRHPFVGEKRLANKLEEEYKISCEIQSL